MWDSAEQNTSLQLAALWRPTGILQSDFLASTYLVCTSSMDATHVPSGFEASSDSYY